MNKLDYLNSHLEHWKTDFLQPRSLGKTFVLRLIEVIFLTTFVFIGYSYYSLSTVEIVILVLLGGIVAIFLSNIIYRTVLTRKWAVSGLFKLQTVVIEHKFAVALTSIMIVTAGAFAFLNPSFQQNIDYPALNTQVESPNAPSGEMKQFSVIILDYEEIEINPAQEVTNKHNLDKVNSTIPLPKKNLKINPGNTLAQSKEKQLTESDDGFLVCGKDEKKPSAVVLDALKQHYEVLNFKLNRNTLAVTVKDQPTEKMRLSNVAFAFTRPPTLMKTLQDNCSSAEQNASVPNQLLFPPTTLEGERIFFSKVEIVEIPSQNMKQLLFDVSGFSSLIQTEGGVFTMKNLKFEPHEVNEAP